MTKLNVITIHENYGILKVQNVELSEDKNGLIEIKGNVGSGKSSFAKTAEIGLGASKAITNKILIGKKIDIEEQITYGDTRIFIRTKKSANSSEFKTSIYCKDPAGRKMTPVINGKAPTAAQLQSILRTELTFGTDKFLSENPRINFEFMQDVYQAQLYDVGIIFDKKDEAYSGSILDRLELAKIDRSNKFEVKRKMVGFKDTLEEEGHKEDNIPTFVDVKAIKTKIHELTHKAMNLRVSIINENTNNSEKYTADLLEATNARNTKLTALRLEYQNLVNEAVIYNDKLNARHNLNVEELKTKIIAFSNGRGDITAGRNRLLKSGFDVTNIDKLITTIADSNFENKLKARLSNLKPANPILLDDKKRPIGDTDILADEALVLIHKMNEVWDASKSIDEVDIKKPITLSYEQSSLINYTGENTNCRKLAGVYDDIKRLDLDIVNSEETNNIYNRWASFHDHQAADRKVAKIWKEYKLKFADLDLGVDGLRMMVIGNEDKQEIRTMYNGVHNPELFHNPKGDYRFIVGNDGYSHTQQAIIAVLMQIYLLERKRDNGDEGLRHMWLTCPLDNKTRDMLIEIQKKHDMKFICETTGDFQINDLEEGSFIIENGYLLNNLKID